MKKWMWAAAFALMGGLGACSLPQQQAQAPAAAANCDKSAANVVAFTAPDAQDVVEARSIGADCAKAVIVLTVRNQKGEPVWAWASAHSWAGDREGGATPEAMDAFLADLAKVTVDTTASLPEWPERDTVFAGELGAYMSTPYDREAYNEIRNKAYPRLCHATSMESGACVYVDTQTGVVFKVFESGV